MVTTRLEINDISQPFGVNIPVVITLNLADVREPDKRKASFSKTIELPATNEINKLFENIYEVNISTQYFNKNKKTPCKYFVNDILNFEGNLKLSKITLRPDKSIVYEVNIIGEGGTLFVNIGEKLIKGNASSADDLDFSAYNHTYNRATQISSRTAYADGVNVRYPFVDRGTNGGSDTVWNTTDFLPCFHLYEYVSKIIAKAGYTFTSSILSSAEFKKYLLFPNITNVALTQAQLENKQWYVGMAVDQTLTFALQDAVYGNSSTNGFFDLGTQLDAPDKVITLNASGFYNLCTQNFCKVVLTHSDPSVAKIECTVTVAARIMKSSNGGTSYFSLGTSNSNITLFVGNVSAAKPVGVPIYGNADFATGSQSFTTGDKFKVSVNVNNQNIVKYYNSSDVEIFPAGTLTVVTSLLSGTAKTSFYGLCTQKNIVAGDPLVCNSALPVAIKQKDLLKSVFQALNLYVDNDPLDKNNLIIESFDPFYNTTTPVNFENKTDLLKDITVNPNLLEGKKYSFSYKKDADYFNTLYQNEFNEAFGTESVNTESDFTQAEVKNEIIFSATPNAANYGLGIAHPRIYKFDNNVKSPIAPNIRWLYNGGVKQTANSYTYQEQGQTDLVTNDYLYCGHTDDPMNATIDLNFGIPKKVYYSYVNAYFTNNNFYNRFQKFYLDTLIGRDSKIVTKYLWLSPKDINEFSFRNRIFNDGAYWIVNKVVNYDALQENSTLCELVKLNKSSVFVPTQTLISNSGANAGVDVSTARLNTSSSLGTGNQNFGRNSIVVGDYNIVPESASNINITGNNVIISEGLSNVNVVNSSNITVTQSNVSYVNGIIVDVFADLASALVTKTENYTLTITNGTVLFDCTSGNWTASLPKASDCFINGVGKIFNIKKIDATANTLTIDPTSTETIDGSLTKVLSVQWECLTIQSNGSNWNIL